MIAKEEHSSMCLKNRISIKKTVIFFLIFILLFLTIQVPFYKGQEYGYQYKNVYEKLHNFERFEGNSDVIFLGDSVGWQHSLRQSCGGILVLVRIISVRLDNG